MLAGGPNALRQCDCDPAVKSLPSFDGRDTPSEWID